MNCFLPPAGRHHFISFRFSRDEKGVRGYSKTVDDYSIVSDSISMYEYQLPNGLVINIERIVQAILVDSEYPQVFLDTKTGALIEIPSPASLKEWVKEIGQTNRYFVIERFNKQDRHLIAKDFIELILKDELPTSKVKKAYAVLVDGDWDIFADFLLKHTDGWMHAWDQYVYDEAYEHAENWLVNNPHITITPVFVGCGNCVICDAIKNDEMPSEEKLRELFATEEVMQHVQNQMISPSSLQKELKEIVPTQLLATQETATKKTKRKVTASGHTNKQNPTNALVFKITLNHVKPRVWRRIIVPADYTFYDLHCTIQDSMGWDDSHLHAFNVDLHTKQKSNGTNFLDKIITITLPHQESDENDRDERKEKLVDWFGKVMQQCIYEYDFGDGWVHTILFEKSIPYDKKATLPQCTHGKNACPPDDCGGVWGYKRVKQILKNPKHAEHSDMLDWLGLESADEFDPTHFDSQEIEFDDPKASLKEYEKYSGLKPL